MKCYIKKLGCLAKVEGKGREWEERGKDLIKDNNESPTSCCDFIRAEAVQFS